MVPGWEPAESVETSDSAAVVAMSPKKTWAPAETRRVAVAAPMPVAALDWGC